MRVRGRRGVALGASVVLTAGLLAGCGGDEDKEPKTTRAADGLSWSPGSGPKDVPATSTPSSGSATSSGTETAAPTSTDDPGSSSSSSAASEKTEASAEQFVRDYWATYNRAERGLTSASALDVFTSSQCKTCPAVKDVILKRAAAGRKLNGDPVRIQRIRGQSDDGKDKYVVFTTLMQQPVSVIDKSSKVVSKIAEASDDKAFELAWSNGWKLTAIRGLDGGF